MNSLRSVAFEVAGTSVSALLLRPLDASALLVLGHGAGAGMRHIFMEEIAALLGERGIATLRYQFPYMEVGRRYPNPQRILTATVRRAVAAASEAAPDLPLFAGGKSMGGRMTSLAAAEAPLPGVRGIVFLGFPLHGIGKPPGIERSEHLGRVEVPFLFVQGTRDRLANLDFLRPVVHGAGAARDTPHRRGRGSLLQGAQEKRAHASGSDGGSGGYGGGVGRRRTGRPVGVGRTHPEVAGAVEGWVAPT